MLELISDKRLIFAKIVPFLSNLQPAANFDGNMKNGDCLFRVLSEKKAANSINRWQVRTACNFYFDTGSLKVKSL